MSGNIAIERKPWKVYGVSRTTWWRWEKAGLVPKRFELGPNTKGCLVEELEQDVAEKRAKAL